MIFDRESVRVLVPYGPRPTVYRIYRDLERIQLVYVGATMCPHTRLLEHIRNGMPGAVVTLEFCGSGRAMHRAESEAMASEEPEMKSVARRHGTWKARA